MMENERIDFNKANKSRETPFYIACKSGNFELVKYMMMMNKKIDLNKTDKNGYTPFAITINTLKYTLNDQIDNNRLAIYKNCPLGAKVFNEYIDIIKYMMQDKRIDLNKSDNCGCTPFFIACDMGYLNIVKLMMENERIDFNKANDDEETPFYTACKNCHFELIKLI